MLDFTNFARKLIGGVIILKSKWSDDELGFLIENYSGMSACQIGVIIGRDKTAVIDKLRGLGFGRRE